MDFDKKYFAAASILLIAAVGIGFAVLSASSEAESPETTYGYLPVSADSGFFDLPALMVAGPSYGNDYPDKYRCWKDSFYIDQDDDRDVEYFDGENLDLSPGEYYTGYEKSYADAEACGGRYNYRCDFTSGCKGVVDDDSGDDGSSDDDENDGSDDSDDSSSSTNKPPEIESIDTPASVNTSETFTVSVEASDPDDPSLSYSWSNGETGQSISLNYGEPGVKELDVEVSDGDKSTSSTVRVNVVEPRQPGEPVVDPNPNPFQRFWNWFTALFKE